MMSGLRVHRSSRRVFLDGASLGIIVRAQHRYRRREGRSWRGGASPHALSGSPCPGSRSEIRLRPNLSVARSTAPTRTRSLGHPPIEDCSSAERIRRWRCDFDSKGRLERPQRAAGSRVRIRSAREDRPTRPHPARSPLALLENAACDGRHELVWRSTELSADLVHCLGDLVGRVPGEVFLQCVAEELASRPLGAPRQLFCASKHLVWNRHRRFHTKSITKADLRRQRRLTRGGICRGRCDTGGDRACCRSGSQGGSDHVGRPAQYAAIGCTQAARPSEGTDWRLLNELKKELKA